MNSKFLSLNSLNPCIAPLTEKDEHLKREYIEVHALTLEPVACTCGFVARILLVVDSYEDDRVDDEGDEEIVMDENYESPVVIEVKERKSLSPADFFKAAAKVGKMLLDDTTPPDVKKEKKKNQGFFGIGAEVIQLDGNDANTLK